MTVTGGFPREDDLGPSYPTLFGITFTPTITGALVAVAGIGLAVYAATQFVSPKLSEYQEIKTRVEQKKTDLEQKEATAQRVDAIVAQVNRAKQENKDVRGLFSDQQALDTLLLDLNRVIVSTNAELLTFKPTYETSGVVADSSLGETLNNKIKRQVTAVSFQGTFNQTLQIMQAIDQLQTVLVVRDLSMELQTTDKPGEPRNVVKSTFNLHAYVPLSPEEAVAAAQAAAAQAKPEAKPN
ncbi:MAG: pilus assembly protein PilO [Acaryochloridaceae cyanobacterium CSU_3_4]|nr:pilus assembly protein PilO [Acaryochloris sp. SU_5_25]NJN38662.1 pilus assembly protein PilO [Acaryochloridaceae cyanobacterium CSU_3_4]